MVKAVEASPYASQVESYWTAAKTQAASLRSRDGRSALVVARIAGDDSQAPERAADLTEPLTGTHDGVTVLGGGIGNAYQQVNDQTKTDLAVAESIAIPITADPAGVGLRQHRRRRCCRWWSVCCRSSAPSCPCTCCTAFTDVSSTPSTSRPPSAWASGSTTRCSSSRGSARSCATATTVPARYCSRCAPPAGPCCSRRSPSRCRSPPCWSSRCSSYVLRVRRGRPSCCRAARRPGRPAGPPRRPRRAGQLPRPAQPLRRALRTQPRERSRSTRASGTASRVPS